MSILSVQSLRRLHLGLLFFAVLPIIVTGQAADESEDEEEEDKNERDWSLILGLVAVIVALGIAIVCLVVVICEIRASKPIPEPKTPQVELSHVAIQTDPPESPPELVVTIPSAAPSTVESILFGRDLDGLYTLKERFAQGRYQKVIYASPLGSQREVALKVFEELERCQHEYNLYSNFMDPETSKMEREAQSSIPELIDAGTITIDDRKRPVLVFEAAQISLKDYVIPKRGSAQYVVMSERSIFYQICNSLKYIHHNGFAHGDIHVGSAMFFTSRWKLIDFSNWGNSEVEMYSRSTPHYTAPEVVKAVSNNIERIPYNQAADIWSLGLLGWELLTKRPLLPTSEYTEEDIMHMSFGDIPFPWEGKPAQFWSAIKSPSAVKLIQNCIRRDPEQRWNIDKVIQYMKFWS